MVSPSAGGLFSGSATKESVDVRGGRFDSETGVGQLYGGQYLKDELLKATSRVHEEALKHNITGHAVALRWVLHHSVLKKGHGDAMIIGASSTKQLEENLKICSQGPLPEELVKVVEDVWPAAKPFAPFAHM